MVFYPLNKAQKEAFKNFNNGNFSLWYNKYIPLNKENKKASDDRGKEDRKIEFYANQYGIITKNKNNILLKKHMSQMDFCNYYSNIKDYEKIVITAKLKSPLVTGIGQTHPSEVSLVFDRNIGVPYISASSIKGIARFAYVLSEVLDDSGELKEEYKDKDEANLEDIGVVDIFGGEKKKKDSEKNEKESIKGNVIFLDAYPVNVPELKVDIMNPHYGKYYAGDEPPADYLTPNPIKFLTVSEGAKFVFRAVVKKEVVDIDKIKSVLEKAITEEGVGAKTSLGYGLFEIEGYDEPQTLISEYEKYLEENLTEEEKLSKKKEKFIEQIKDLKEVDSNLDFYFNKWQNDENLKDNKEIAEIFKKKVKKKKANKEYTEHYKTVAKILNINLDVTDSQSTDLAPSSIIDKNEKEKILKELNRYLEKGINKKTFKKVHKKYKKFESDKEIKDKLSELKRLVRNG